MSVQHPSVFEELKKVDALIDARHEPEMVVERLPFTVRVVRSEEDILKAVAVRHSAYARHVPVFAQGLREPEEDDTKPDVAIMLAESKLDGTPLGTVRVQINHDRPLNMESSVELPAWLRRSTIADARRLGIVRGGEGGLVKMILFKALFQYWAANEVDWAVVAARPPLNRTYEKLLFSDVLEGETFLPHPREHNVPHQVLAFEVATAKERWTAANHPLLKFMCFTHHPDIDLGIPTGATAPMLPVQPDHKKARIITRHQTR
jgi:hypothetical protein